MATFRFNIALDGRQIAVRARGWSEAFAIASSVVRDLSDDARIVTVERMPTHADSMAGIPPMRDDETVGSYVRRLTGADK